MVPPASPPPPEIAITDEEVRAEIGYLRRLARALVGDRSEAADLAQTTYLRAAPHLSGVTARQAYLRRTMINLLTDRHRRNAVVREVPLDDLSGDRAAPGDPFTQVDQRMELRAALDRLAPMARQIVVLRYLEDVPVAEIADLLGRPAGTVRRVSADALRALAPHIVDDSREGRS